MAIKRIEGSMNVLEAAKQRLRNVFKNKAKVYMSFSAGKDSLCMAHLVYSLILSGEADPKLLTVIFIDEEAIYPSMEELTLKWRKRFLAVGAEFRWYCLPVRQVSILHHLQNNEEWITWEPGKEAVWCRQPPLFAITRSPYLEYPGQMNYQTFVQTITKDGISLIGVRAAESLQRAQYIARMNMGADGITGFNAIYPIYDWKDTDVWRYITDNHLDFPKAYLDLYRVGVIRNRLRLSNFFAAESIAGLRYIAETDPKLWESIERREPNAYLTLLYWDSEMFKRSTRTRTQMEGESNKDYKALCKKVIFDEPKEHFPPSAENVWRTYRSFYIKFDGMMQMHHYKRMYEAIIAGDPKLRTLRALYTVVSGDYVDDARTSGKGGESNG